MPTRDNGYMSDKSTRDPSKNPYLGTQYEEQWNSNPYANNNREDSVWDRIGNLFGFRTGADKWQDELDVRSQEYDAQLASVVREEEYNSESAKVARMKAAGLNPDLQGLGDASSASEMTEPETSPESAAESSSALDSVGKFISLGAGFTESLLKIGNMFLSLEQQGLLNEGLATDNASALVDLVNGTGSTFDMPDLDLSPIEEGQEGVEGVILDASTKISGRNQELANALYGFPRSRRALRAKSDFLASMNRRNGTLSAFNQHLVGELTKATLSGDLNAAKAALQGRKSMSNAPILEKFMLRSVMNDLEYDAIVSDINLRFASDPDNQENLLQGMENQAIEVAETDPHLAAIAANAGFVADAADAGAVVDESKARKKQAALDKALAEYKQEQLKIVRDYYDELVDNNSGKPPRKMIRQYRNQFGLAPVNEPYYGGTLVTGGSANYSASRRTSSSIVKRLK